MKNQTSGKGGASPELQPKIDPASKNISGQAPMAVSLRGMSVPTSNASQSGPPGPIEPDSAKGGHD